MRRPTRFALALTVATALAGGAPASAAGRADLRTPSYLHVTPTPGGLARITDASGRDVWLRGVNVTGLQDDHVDSGPDETGYSYPQDPAAYAGGRCPADDPRVEDAVLCEADFPQLRDEGYDVIRLTINWSLLEPQPGRISATYLDRIAQVVGWADAVGIRTVLDMHTDGWSRYLETPPGQTCPPGTSPAHGQDGAPAWALDQTTLPDCSYVDNSLDPAVEGNAQRLYADAPGPDGVGLAEHYASLFAALAGRFGADPGVAGYEIENEPLPGFAPGAAMPAELMRLDAQCVAAMQAARPGFEQLVFIEPEAERNLTGAPQVVAPWAAYSSYGNVVYAPHVYTGVFTRDDISYSQDYADAVGDAQRIGLPLWVGEFGGPPDADPSLMQSHLAQQDAYGIGSTLWDWKDNHTGSGAWSVYLQPFGGTNPGTPNTLRRLLAARAYPEAVDGTVTSLAEDPLQPLTFRLAATGPAVADGDLAHATVVELPAAFAGTPVVTGASFAVAPRGAGREVALFPTGGPYSLALAAGPAPQLPEAPTTWLLALAGVATVAVVARRRSR